MNAPFHPTPSAAWTDFTPTGPWSDGTIVVRNSDGVGFTYSASLNALTANPNLSASIKNANNFIVSNLPAPTNGGDAANKTYVDAHAGSGGIPEAPTDGQLYGRESSAWSVVPPVPVASSTVPLMDGTAAVGTGTTWSRTDHIHPSDTTKAPLVSPTFTGTPAAPTPATADNSTTLSTTAFVKAQGYLITNATITISGDISGSGTTAISATLATVNSNVGTYQGITVNGKGLVTGAINMSYAPLASPIFTGVPVAPNPTAGTNTTQLATTAFVGTALANAAVPAPSSSTPGMDGVGAAGSATVYSRGDHVHPSDTTKAPLVSPALSGTPTAPTASVGTNTTQVATTAFVLANAGTGGGTPVYIADTPPTGAAANSLWWESDTGQLYIYYNDGDSTQWVTAAPQPDVSVYLQKSGGTMTGTLTLNADPSTALGAATKQYVDNATGGLFRSYLAGLILSTAGSSAMFSITAGAALDSTNINMMQLASPLTKTTAAWAVGPGNGSFDGTGAAPSATSEFCHVHLIKRTDTQVVDVLTSLSATAPTLPTNYTLFRRIGAMKTNASFQWIAFVQIGDDFLWSVPIGDVAGAAPGIAPATYTLSVPPGISVLAKFTTAFTNTSGVGNTLLFYSPLTAPQAFGTPSGNGTVTSSSTGFFTYAQCSIWTDTLAHIMSACQSATGNTVYIVTDGWTDRRGRDA
jgi:hypothetical protein